MRVLQTDQLKLRSLNQADADRIKKLAGEYDVAKTTLNIPHPYPEEAATDFIEMALKKGETGELYVYAIEQISTNDLIGIIHIQVAPTHQRGELGYWIGKPYWGKGYATEAARAMLQFGFENLSMHKIYGTAVTTNTGSWKVLKNIGMTYEGTLKEHRLRWGQYFDIGYYGILKEDYLKHQ